jgi:septum formation protein
LLTAAGFSFEVCAVDVDERVLVGEAPETYVRRLAAAKSAAALAIVRQSSQEPAIVLGADTAVIVADRILGKPRDDREAAEMLRALSGRSHVVITGVSARTRETEAGAVERTTVEFEALEPADIEWYVASGEGRDKAGAYAVQGLASRFIPRIEGSYSNVVGLPVAAVHKLFQRIASAQRSGYPQL